MSQKFLQTADGRSDSKTSTVEEFRGLLANGEILVRLKLLAYLARQPRDRQLGLRKGFLRSDPMKESEILSDLLPPEEIRQANALYGEFKLNLDLSSLPAYPCGLIKLGEKLRSVAVDGSVRRA